MSEFDWIDVALSPLTRGEKGTFNLKNDGAFLTHEAGQQIVVTSDTLIEGSHFLQGESPADIARKAMRVNLSDIASMGAQPLCYTLNLALTKDLGKAFLYAFVSGLIEDQDGFGVYLLGGDTTVGDGRLCITMTHFGVTQAGQCWARNGACAGDYAYVTGSIGEGLLGLYLRQGKLGQGKLASGNTDLSERLVSHHLQPQPRCQIHALANKGFVKAAIDVSDGLLADMEHICKQSSVGLDMIVDDLPIDEDVKKIATQNDINPADLASGGDDYELILAIDEKKDADFQKAIRDFAFPFTKIGQFHKTDNNESKTVRLLTKNGDDITPETKGWQHF